MGYISLVILYKKENLLNRWLLLLIVPLLSVHAQTVWVDSYRGKKDATGEKLHPHNQIQTAIDSPFSKEIRILSGKYSENIAINKTLILKNLGGPIILEGLSHSSFSYPKQSDFYYSPNMIAIGPNFVLKKGDHITIVSSHSIQILTPISIPSGASLHLMVDNNYSPPKKLSQNPPVKRVSVGESQTITIKAKDYWNHTGIYLEKGAEYSFIAQGNWIDWYIESDANGFRKDSMKLFESLRRAPKENWFSLIGSINKEKSFFIGKNSQVVASDSGELVCFANDVPFFYWNNKGSLELIVKRIR